jgi:hypothetical protein
MEFFLTSLILLSAITAPGVSLQRASPQTSPAAAMDLEGRWRVNLSLSGGAEKNLVFDSRAKGSGSFLLLDTGPDDKPVAVPQPAVWSQLTNDRVSFSGEVELPIGTCCREIGTLIFKGKFASSNSISGKFIFVTSVDEEESPYGLRSMIGTFTATRLPNK